MYDDRWTIPQPRIAPPFVREHRRFDRMLGPFEDRMLDACITERGLGVLDVGCGAGSTSLAAAHRVGPEGLVLGVDIDADAIAVAARRGRMALLPQAQFRCADAAALAMEGFDRVISRFGVLHFANPVAAFSNLRRALAPRGTIAFVCAREPARNPWATRPARVVKAVLGSIPQPDVGRGPFALADPDRIRDLLAAAGFSNVRLETIDEPVVLGDDIEDVVEFFFETDLRKIDAHLTAEQARAIADGLRRVLVDWQEHDAVRSPASCWLVTAERL